MTDMTEFERKVREFLPEVKMIPQESMAKHTSFRIGGPAEMMAFPKNSGELSVLLRIAAETECPTAILGAGTNVLAPDSGMTGLVICLKDSLDGLEQTDETHIRAAAGVTMTRAAVFAAGLGLSGLEFAHGIPGSVGGGVYMNAGAYGGEICQVCSRVGVMDLDGTMRELTGEEMEFSYRHSILEDQKAIVLWAEFALQPADPEKIRGKMRELMAKRSASQPLDMPSAGSAFKRPVGGYAAALIEGAGLKGFRMGNAGISEKHAGFAVNLGNATAEEVKNLLREVSNRVYEQSGIRLEPEVRIW